MKNLALIIRIIFYIAIILGLAVAINKQKEKIIKSNTKTIVSFFSEYEKNGKPVYIRTIKNENLKVLQKISGKVGEKNKIISYVSKDIQTKLKNNDSFFIETDDDKIYGEVVNISNTADYKTGLFTIELLLTSDIKLTKGSVFTCYINVSTISNSIVLPREIIQSDENGSFVFTVNENDNLKKAQKKYIDLGFSDGFDVVVKKGINLNDKVVIEGYSILEDNDKIDVVKEV